MAALGLHVLCEFWDAEALNDPRVAETALRDAVAAAGATLVELFVHTFSPYGVSAVAVIAESHLALHTWPEQGYAAVDLFTCGKVDAETMLRVLVAAFRPRQVQRRIIRRGVAPPAVAGEGGTGAELRVRLPGSGRRGHGNRLRSAPGVGIGAGPAGPVAGV